MIVGKIVVEKFYLLLVFYKFFSKIVIFYMLEFELDLYMKFFWYIILVLFNLVIYNCDYKLGKMVLIFIKCGFC